MIFVLSVLWTGSVARRAFFIAAVAISILAGAYSSFVARDALPLILCTFILPGLVLMERTIGVADTRRQTITSIWFLTYLVMLFWPSFLVFADHPGDARAPFLISVASGILTVPLGAWLVARLTGSGHAERDRFFRQAVDADRPTRALLLIGIAITTTIGLSVALYFALIPELPLLYMLRYPGCDLVLAQLREESFKFLDPRYAATGTPLFYLFLPLRTIVDPYIVVAFFGIWWVTRSRAWLVLFLLVLALSSVYAAATIARAPVAAIVLRMFMLYYLLHAGAIGWRSLATWSLAVLAFPTLVTALAYAPGPPPADCGPAALRGPVAGRIALVDTVAALSALTAVPADSPRPTGTPRPTTTVIPTTIPVPGGTPRPTTTAVPTTIPVVTPRLTLPSLPPIVAAPPTPPPPTPPPAGAPERVSRTVQSASAAAMSVVRRLTYTEAWALYLYFTVFPSQHDWLYGQTLVKPVLRFVGADFYVENFVYQKVFPTSAIPSGHLNAAFQSNLYADFGLPGVVTGGIAVGAIMHGLQIFLFRRRRSILWLATFPSLVYAFWVLHSGSITSVLITNGALLVLLIPATILLAERLLVRLWPALARPS